MSPAAPYGDTFYATQIADGDAILDVGSARCLALPFAKCVLLVVNR